MTEVITQTFNGLLLWLRNCIAVFNNQQYPHLLDVRHGIVDLFLQILSEKIIFLVVCKVTKVAAVPQRKTNCRMTSRMFHKVWTPGKEESET